MSLSEAIDDPPAAAAGRALPWNAGALAVLMSFPALFTRGLIGDDWSGYYVFWTEGAYGFAHWMIEVAHAGYSIPMLLFLYLGEDMPNVAARIVGLSCHCLSGLLLYRVLDRSWCTRPIAALATALFLLTPFYVLRLTLNGAYDYFLVFYLLSYVLMNSSYRLLRWLAPISLLFSLSLETLIALEPLRLLFVKRSGERWATVFVRLIPFGLVIGLVILLRLTILGKSGHYIAQYAATKDIHTAMAALGANLRAFPRGLVYAYKVGSGLLGRNVSALTTLAAATLFALLGAGPFRTAWLLKSRASTRNTIALVLLGATITLLGSLPYALAGIYGDVTREESRLLFPSQFGVLLLLATLIQSFRGQRLRAAIIGGTIAVFALSMAHDTKWLLYDGLVTSDLNRQARAALLADPEAKLVKLKIQTSAPLFFRGRCLGGNDLNSSQQILRDESRQRSFIYSTDCGDFTNPDIVPVGRCPVSYLDGFRCPPRRETWLYRPEPGIPPLDQIGMVELLLAVVSRSPTPTGGRGELVKLTDDLQSPLERAVYLPPCNRAGARASLWLLALPVPNCENISAGD